MGPQVTRTGTKTVFGGVKETPKSDKIVLPRRDTKSLDLSMTPTKRLFDTFKKIRDEDAELENG